MEIWFVLTGPLYLQFFVHKCDFLSRSFFSIITHSSIHRFQLGFVNGIIATIRLICFTNLNAMHLYKYVHDMVYLKCCTKWASNEYNFCPLLRMWWTSEKLTSIIWLYFFCVVHIQIASHKEILTTCIKYFLLHLIFLRICC